MTASVRIFQEFGSIADEAQGWTLLAEESNSPMTQYSWVKACSTAFAEDGKLQLIVIGGDQPSALAPFVIRGGRLYRMECLGVSQLYEPTDFPHSDPVSLHHLIRTLVELRRPLLLNRVLADSPVLTALRDAFQSKGFVLTRRAAGYPWIALDSSWMEPERKVSTGRRSSLRRGLRKAENMGEVGFDVIAPRPSTLAPLLAEMFRIEAANWKGRNGSALLNDPIRRTFYEQYAASACQKGILRIAFMTIGRRAVATQLAVESKGGYWLLKVGYDEAYACCSPGNLLLLETLRYAARRKLQSYEFLGSSQPWTEIWTKQVRPCVNVAAYPKNFKGVAAFIWDAFRFGCGRLRK